MDRTIRLTALMLAGAWVGYFFGFGRGNWYSHSNGLSSAMAAAIVGLAIEAWLRVRRGQFKCSMRELLYVTTVAVVVLSCLSVLVRAR